MSIKIIAKLVMLIISFSTIIYASSENNCGTTQNTNFTNLIPKTGTLRVFVVFVQFKDDDSSSTAWPKNQYPSWASGFVNTTVSNNYPYNNLSQYFDDMSNNTFHIIGDVYPYLVITNYDETNYSSIGAVNYEVLTKIDPDVDFSKYDNLNGNSWGSDGKVDFIYIIYRNSKILFNYTGIAHLSLSPTTYTTNDGVAIIDGGYIGSGVQQRGGLNGATYTKFISAHELGHYLFGGGHIDFISNLGLMTGKPFWNDDRGMISWERHKLGWVSYIDKTSDSEFWVSDYFSTDKVFRIPISSKEYYLIENRQKIDPNDYAADKGIYIYYVTNADSYPPKIDVKCADGDWNFNYNSSKNELTRTSVNPTSGKDEMNYFVNGIACIKPYYPEDDAAGDAEDAFDLTYNNVFSPWSNPRVNSGYFSVEIVDKVGSKYKLHLYFTNPQDSSPSKPQDLKVTMTSGINGHPKLTWNSNEEPDISKYYIYRASEVNGTLGSYHKIATVNHNGSSNTQSYIDYSVSRDPSSNVYFHYKIKAVDTQNKTSIYSDSKKIKGNGPIEKIEARKEAVNIKGFGLKQNYPNPFNPSTEIIYRIGSREYVSLKVYNSLGEVVRILENGEKPAGEYKVEFNAENLPGGIYFYRLRAGKHQLIRKMILLK